MAGNGIGRQRELLTAISVCEKEYKHFQKVVHDYPIKLAERLNEVGKEVIASWYATYEPHKYNRTRSLYHAFKVEIKGFDVIVNFDSEYMEGYAHRVSNDYIFENSFVEGYHGGADSGKGHPDPGNPRWRKPFPEFTRWGKLAPKTFSPYEEIIRRMQIEIDVADDELSQELDKIVERIRRTVLAYLRK